MLVNLQEILAEGRRRGIGVGSFNTPNLESAIAVLDAAEELNLPVIIAHAQCHDYAAPLDRVAPMMVALAKASKVPVCVHLDHGEDFDYCKRAIEWGFTSAMIDKSTCPYEENIAESRRMVEYAHAHGASVEAELGCMPAREGGGENASEHSAGMYTDPNLVDRFVRETGVDALAIAFGTAHGIYKTRPVLNLDVITAVAKVTDLPLVMHGGSGISHDEYREVIRRGIRKINYYTYMSYAGYEAAAKMTKETPAGYYHDLTLVAAHAMKENAETVLKVFAGM